MGNLNAAATVALIVWLAAGCSRDGRAPPSEDLRSIPHLDIPVGLCVPTSDKSKAKPILTKIEIPPEYPCCFSGTVSTSKQWLVTIWFVRQKDGRELTEAGKVVGLTNVSPGVWRFEADFKGPPNPGQFEVRVMMEDEYLAIGEAEVKPRNR